MFFGMLPEILYPCPKLLAKEIIEKACCKPSVYSSEEWRLQYTTRIHTCSNAVLFLGIDIDGIGTEDNLYYCGGIIRASRTYFMPDTKIEVKAVKLLIGQCPLPLLTLQSCKRSLV